MPALPKTPLLDASIVVNGVDFSNTSNQVSVKDTAAKHDVTGFQGGGYVENTPGLKTAEIGVTVFQDYTGGSVHQTCAPIYRAGEAVLVVIKPDDEAISETNPAFAMVSKLYEYNPVDAKVGDPQQMTLAFENGSKHGLREFKSQAELEAFEAEL